MLRLKNKENCSFKIKKENKTFRRNKEQNVVSKTMANISEF